MRVRSLTGVGVLALGRVGRELGHAQLRHAVLALVHDEEVVEHREVLEHHVSRRRAPARASCASSGALTSARDQRGSCGRGRWCGCRTARRGDRRSTRAASRRAAITRSGASGVVGGDEAHLARGVAARGQQQVRLAARARHVEREALVFLFEHERVVSRRAEHVPVQRDTSAWPRLRPCTAACGRRPPTRTDVDLLDPCRAAASPRAQVLDVQRVLRESRWYRASRRAGCRRPTARSRRAPGTSRLRASVFRSSSTSSAASGSRSSLRQ